MAGHLIWVVQPLGRQWPEVIDSPVLFPKARLAEVWPALALAGLLLYIARRGQVAQLVEQRTENPRVGGSIPSLAMNLAHRRTPHCT
jgi:hypothetical protein